jgi:predicted secreted protein
MDRKIGKAGKTWTMVALLLMAVALMANAPIDKIDGIVHASGFSSTSSMSPPKDWSQTYGGSGNEAANSLVQTSDGGYALAGWTGSSGAGNADFWLVRTDSTGNQQWSQTYGGTGDDEAFSMIQTSDGGYAIAGYTTSFGAGYTDFWLVKTDSAGIRQWDKTYGGPGNDEAYSVVQTNDSGYALAGYTGSSNGGGLRFWLVKTDSNGIMQWNQTYGGPGDSEAYSIIKASDGGYAIAGSTDSFGAGGLDFWLVKTDSNGTMQWNETYGGPGDDVAYSLVQTSDGGYAVAGYTNSVGSGGEFWYYYWLVKTNSNGTMQWNEVYGGQGSSEAYSVIQTSDGGYAMAGYTNSIGAGGDDVWLVKTDSVGNMQWNQTYGGSGDEAANSLIRTSDGGYAMAGYTDSFGAGGEDFYLVKTDSVGASSSAGGINWGSILGYVTIGVVLVIIIVAAWSILSRRRRRTDSLNSPKA